MEMALTLALNGFFVHMIDLEGSGYSAGNRINNLLIEKFHHQVSTILLQVSSDLPCFLLGHSMGGLTVNTYLGLNPQIADKLAGVIYSAPFFGIPKKMNAFEKLIISGIAKVMDELVMISSLPIHKICRNKQYMRQAITTRKSNPFMTAGLVDSWVKNHERVATFASKVNYPYLILLGEKDVIVDNAASRAWHAKTSSTVKELKLMAGSFHELSKEPNNGIMFETMLKFMAKRITDGAKPFGALDPKTGIRFAKQVAAWKKKKFWVIISVLYLFIGLLIAIIRRQKNLFLSWPALLVIAKRLK